MSLGDSGPGPLPTRLQSLCKTITAECDSLRQEIATLRAEADTLRKRLAIREAQSMTTHRAILSAVNKLVNPRPGSCCPGSTPMMQKSSQSGGVMLTPNLGVDSGINYNRNLSKGWSEVENEGIPVKTDDDHAVASAFTSAAIFSGISSKPFLNISPNVPGSTQTHNASRGAFTPAAVLTSEAVNTFDTKSVSGERHANMACIDAACPPIPFTPPISCNRFDIRSGTGTISSCNVAPNVTTRLFNPVQHSGFANNFLPGLLGIIPKESGSRLPPSLVQSGDVEREATENEANFLLKVQPTTRSIRAKVENAITLAPDRRLTCDIAECTSAVAAPKHTQECSPTSMSPFVLSATQSDLRGSQERQHTCGDSSLETKELSEEYPCDNVDGKYGPLAEKESKVVLNKSNLINIPHDENEITEPRRVLCISSRRPFSSYSLEEVRLADYYRGGSRVRRALVETNKPLLLSWFGTLTSNTWCVECIPSSQRFDEAFVKGASICFRPPFEAFSIEEVRLADYNANTDRESCCILRKRMRNATRRVADASP